MRFFWIIIGVLLINLNAHTQVNRALSFDRDTITIGDEVILNLSIEVDKNVEVLGVSRIFLDSLFSLNELIRVRDNTGNDSDNSPKVADYEITSDGGWDDINGDQMIAGSELKWKSTSSGNTLLLENSFSIRLWDPGDIIVPYPTVLYTIGGVQDIFSALQFLSIYVAPPVESGIPQDSLTMAPIKQIKEEPANITDYLVYLIIVVVAICFGLGYWFYTRYYQRFKGGIEKAAEPDIYIPAHLLAAEKLSELNDRELWQKGEIKTYQSELTHIIREYLEGRYGIAALESTTDEIVRILAQELSDKNDVTSLNRILHVADLVKFAKAKPDENIHQSFMTEAVDFVNRTADNTRKIRISGENKVHFENIKDAVIEGGHLSNDDPLEEQSDEAVDSDTDIRK